MEMYGIKQTENAKEVGTDLTNIFYQSSESRNAIFAVRSYARVPIEPKDLICLEFKQSSFPTFFSPLIVEVLS